MLKNKVTIHCSECWCYQRPRKMLKTTGEAEEKTTAPTSGGLLPVETQSPTQLIYKLAGFYLRWNLSILKSNIIAEIPLLFKLIYFLMVYLHSGICILFHSKCYNSTCPILDKTPKLREKIRTVKEENEYKKGLTPPSWRGNTGLSSRERTWRILVFSTLITSVLAFCFNLLSVSLLLQFNKGNFHRWRWATQSSLWGYIHFEKC